MTAKKAKAPKEQTAEIEARLKELKFEAAAAASAAALEASKIFDAKSAEAADVGQEEDEKQDPLLGQSPKASGAEGNSTPAHNLGTSNLAERVTDQRELLLSLTTQVLRLKEQVNKKAPEELGEWIADVESKQAKRFADLEQATRDIVQQHHDRLLELEMKVTALSGEDEGGPGPG